MAKKAKEEIKITKKNLEPEVAAKRPAQTHTEILAEPKVDEPVVKMADPVEPKPQSPLDFLRFPLGALDFDNAGVLFKNPDAPNNKKAIEQFTLLLNLGYKATLRIVDNNYAYFQFDKA